MNRIFISSILVVLASLLMPQESSSFCIASSSPKFPLFSLRKDPFSIDSYLRSPFADSQLSKKPIVVTNRAKFVRKVYSLLFSQVLIAALAVAGTQKYADLFEAFSHPASQLLSFVTVIATSVALSMNEKLRRQYPANVGLLGLFTLAHSVLLSVFAASFDVSLLTVGAMHTMSAFFAATIFTYFSSTDKLASALLQIIGAAAMVLLSGCLTMLYLPAIPIALNALVGLSAIVAVCLLVYDTHNIINREDGPYKSSDYIQASMELFADVVILFKHILIILSKLQQSKENEKNRRDPLF